MRLVRWLILASLVWVLLMGIILVVGTVSSDESDGVLPLVVGAVAIVLSLAGLRALDSWQQLPWVRAAAERRERDSADPPSPPRHGEKGMTAFVNRLVYYRTRKAKLVSFGIVGVLVLAGMSQFANAGGLAAVTIIFVVGMLKLAALPPGRPEPPQPLA